MLDLGLWNLAWETTTSQLRLEGRRVLVSACCQGKCLDFWKVPSARAPNSPPLQRANSDRGGREDVAGVFGCHQSLAGIEILPIKKS